MLKKLIIAVLGVRYLRIDREKSLDIAPPQTLKLDTVLEDNILVKEAIHSGLFSQTQGSLFTSTATDVGSLHGTSICLSEFDPVWFETVTGKALADEIERYVTFNLFFSVALILIQTL